MERIIPEPNRNNRVKKEHWWLDIAFFCFLFFCISPFSILAVRLLLGLSYTDILYQMLNVDIYFYIEMMGLISILVLVNYFVIKCKKQSFNSYFGLHRFDKKKSYRMLSYFILGRVALLVILIYIKTRYYIQANSQKIIISILAQQSFYKVFVSVVIKAPIYEEILFRGILFRGLEKSPLGKWGTIITTSLIFSYAHNSYQNTGILIHTFLVGFVAGWLRYRDKSILRPTLLHIFNNAFFMLQLAFF